MWMACKNGSTMMASRTVITVNVFRQLFCGAVLILVKVEDPYWVDVSNFGYQGLQPHQDAVIKEVEQQLGLLAAAMQGKGGSLTSQTTQASCK
jgi:hypothetical protein